MPRVQPKKKPILAILVKRTVLFFFILCLFTVYLYGIGTAQQFMDETQLFFLKLAVILGLSLAVVSLYGIMLNIGFTFKEGKLRFLWSAGTYLILGMIGILVAALAVFIITAAGGNRP